MNALRAACRRIRRAPLWSGQYLREGRRQDDGFLLRLGALLAFTAGALNAGGFETLGFLVSHETGNLSRTSLRLAAGDTAQAAVIGVVVLAFLGGAFGAGLLLSYGARRRWRGRRAFALAFEALLLILFGLGGRALIHVHFPAPAAILVLAFALGLQNAVSSSITQVELRTTHMTGNLTDLGLDLSHWAFGGWAHPSRPSPALVRRRLLLHLGLVFGFFSGVLVGALAFARYGAVCALPLAALLAFVSLPSLALDLETRLRLRARSAG